MILSNKPIISILLFVLCMSKSTWGQEIKVTDGELIRNAKVIILSEWHLVSFFPEYKRQLIEKLYKDDGITDIVLEIGKSYAYLMNEYLETGNENFTNGFDQSVKDYLKELRESKLKLGKPLKIYGIDFERMSIVPALKRVLKKTGNTNNRLFEYLNNLPDSIVNLNSDAMAKLERNIIIQKCRSIYNSNVEFYRTIYDDGYIVKEICENPVVEIEWDKRFEAMSHNFRMLYNNQLRKYLLIIGLFHIDCPVPIYKELENEYKLGENDIINIAMVIKGCETSNMYYGKNKVKLGASKDFFNEPGLIKSLFKNFSKPCMYQLVDIKTEFPNYKPSFKCDYILPIDCKNDDSKCK